MHIENSASGQVVKSSGYSAFVPNPLPPKLEWSNDLVNSLSRADFLLGKLAQDGTKITHPSLLIKPFITREAVLSSKIEGTQASLDDMLIAGADVLIKHNDDEQEVQNYIRALDFGLKRLQELPLSLCLIKELHWHLMQGVRGAHATPGEFSRSQNWIGPPGCTINTAKYVPPPSDILSDCLREFENFLHDRSWPSLIHVAFCHFQFEAIHPFLDGNGRIGRLLIALLLIEREILPSPLLYLSAFFEATRDEYYRQLLNVSANGSWQDWLIYFLNGVAVQSKDVLSRIERINDLLDRWKLQVAGSSTTGVRIVERLAINPYFTINKIAEDLILSYSTTQRGVEKLEQAGIVKRTSDNKRGKIYCAIEILKILDEPTLINMGI